MNFVTMTSAAASCRPNLKTPFLEFLRLTVLMAVAVWLATPLYAQGTGMIEGRVFDAGRGEYLENARLTIAGTNLEAFTDAAGHYRFTQVPGTVANLTVSFTGLTPQAETVTVSPGQAVRRDITLRADSPLVKMSEFVVSTSREMNSAAIAINEQRFSPSIKNVIPADEFGPTMTGNVGDVLRFVPGLSMLYSGGEAVLASINGVPSNNVPVTVAGFDVAAASEGTDRSLTMASLSTNSVARIEVLYSPTPESPGKALAGSINMLPRSAFERSKAVFQASAFVLARQGEPFSFGRIPLLGGTTRPVHPGFNFSYVAPVNERFGYTVSGAHTTQYVPTDFVSTVWRGVSSVTDGNAFPDTTPDRPYLSAFTYRNYEKEVTRSSTGASVDYKLTPRDRISLSFQYIYYDTHYGQRAMTFNVGRVLPGNFSPTATQGATGVGTLSHQNDWFRKVNPSNMTTLIYRHDGPEWKAEAGGAYGYSSSRITDVLEGFFSGAGATRSGVTVAFDGVGYLRPDVITIRDGATGSSLDPFLLRNYVLTTVTTRTPPKLQFNTQRSAYANIRRDLQTRIPVSLKAGVDIRHNMIDTNDGTTAYTFVGRDGVTSTNPTEAGSDDTAGIVVDEGAFHRLPGLGFPRIEFVDNSKLWRLYQSNPSYFTVNEAGGYTNRTNNSKHAEELISSAFIRGDVQLMENRLKIVGGLRAEQTNVNAEGPLTDNTRNYQRNAAGAVIRGSNGQPLLITTDPLARARLTLIERGLHAKKEFLRYFPSINASYNVSENLIARAAYFYSVGRPNFNQYAGGLTLPDLEAPPNPTSNRIVVNNAGIKAWTAETAKVMLEYYFPKVGMVSVGAFRRDFENFFGSIVMKPTPEFLTIYGLDPNTYGDYDVATQHNIQGKVAMEGVDVNYRQELTFLPDFARGIQVFANAAALRATGDVTAAANFSGFIRRT